MARTVNFTAIYAHIRLARICEKYCRHEQAANAWRDAADECVNMTERQIYLNNSAACRKKMSSDGASYTAAYAAQQSFRINGPPRSGGPVTRLGGRQK